MLRCPKCASVEIHCAPEKSKWALLRKRITGKRPHRCKHCGWRGWGEETGPKFKTEDIEVAMRAIVEPLDVASQLDRLDLPQETRHLSFSFESPEEVAARGADSNAKQLALKRTEDPADFRVFP